MMENVITNVVFQRVFHIAYGWKLGLHAQHHFGKPWRGEHIYNMSTMCTKLCVALCTAVYRRDGFTSSKLQAMHPAMKWYSNRDLALHIRVIRALHRFACSKIPRRFEDSKERRASDIDRLGISLSLCTCRSESAVSCFKLQVLWLKRTQRSCTSSFSGCFAPKSSCIFC